MSISAEQKMQMAKKKKRKCIFKRRVKRKRKGKSYENFVKKKRFIPVKSLF